MQFPAAKGTGYHASSHIITSYVLKRNWKQANKKESRALFGVWAGRADWKITFFLFNVSLTRHSSRSGYISLTEIIPPGNFKQIRMHFPDGNHPSRKFLSNQDAFPQRESSLPEILSKSGCISPLEIIPHRLFQQIRMHFLVGNHPSKTFPANQDAFLRWKSSLADISSKSGSISPLEIIPRRHFLLIRMNPIERNHLWTSILANQDEFPPLKKRPSKSVLQKASLKKLVQLTRQAEYT